MPADDAPPLQLIVVEGGGYCDPVTGLCEPAPEEATEADPADAEQQAETLS